VRRGDVTVAKNYMTHEEISTLNLIVNMYLDYAELQAKGHNPMHMADWESKLGDFLRLRSESHVILESIGPIGNELRRSVARGSIFQLVLNRFEEILSNLTFAVVVDREGEYLLDLLIHPLLTGTNIPNTLQ